MKKFKLMCWNCRGLGNPEKCNVVREAIRKSRSDLCILQETKLNAFDLTAYSRILPSYFERRCVVLDAIDSRGGCLIAWKRDYELINSWSTKNTVSAVLRQSATGQCFIVSTVYGPSNEALKQDFILELRQLSTMISLPWIVGGDFNLVRWLVDRTGDMQGLSLMCLFNDMIRDLGLEDVPLKNRSFTWSSKRPEPTLSRLDRIFLSHQWGSTFPVITLEALEMTVSDHAPLLLQCRDNATVPRQPKLELFWLKNEQAKILIQSVWQQEERAQAGDLQSFQLKLNQMHDNLREWHLNNFSEMEKQLGFCKKVILFFDTIEEKRHLQPHEFRLRVRTRERAYMLANYLEKKWMQRSTCRWLKDGDRNTRFFHSLASSKLRRNMVLSVKLDDGTVVHQEDQINRAFFEQMKGLLGEEQPTMHFQPTRLYSADVDLNHLVRRFSEEEIRRAVKQLGRNRASGPDGIPNDSCNGTGPILRKKSHR